MKKCLCLIISAFVLFSSFPCFAVSSASDSAQITADFDMLKNLGVFDGAEISNDSDSITRAQFAVCVYNMFKLNGAADEEKFIDLDKNHFAYNAANALCALGYVNGTSSEFFAPDSYISVNEAVKILVCALGYGSYANLNGGYPAGYSSVAARLGIARGIADGYVTGEILTSLLTDTLEACPLSESKIKDGVIIFDDDDKKSLGEINFDLYKSEGLASEFEAREVSGSEYDKIIIGENAYFAKNFNAFDMVGRYVEFWYTKGEKDAFGSVVGIGDFTDAKVVMIDAEDISSFENNEYFYEKDNKEYTAAVSPSADIFYNGRKIIYFKDLMIPENGSVTLVNYKGGSGYNSVVIKDYKNAYVKSADSEKNVILFKEAVTRKMIENDVCADKSTISLGNDNIDFYLRLFDKNGVEKKLNTLREGYIASVYFDPYDDGAVLYYSTLSVKGTISSVDAQNNEVEINGKNYKYNIALLSANDIKAGAVRKFLLDYKENIVYAETGNAQAELAFVTDSNYTEGADGKPYLTLADVNSESVFKVEVKDKLKLDGIRCDIKKEADLNRVKGLLKRNFQTAATNSYIAPALIRYKLDDSGKLSEIHTANSPEYPDTKLINTYEAQISKALVNTTLNTVGDKILFNDNTIFVDIPYTAYGNELYLDGCGSQISFMTKNMMANNAFIGAYFDIYYLADSDIASVFVKHGKLLTAPASDDVNMPQGTFTDFGMFVKKGTSADEDGNIFDNVTLLTSSGAEKKYIAAQGYSDSDNNGYSLKTQNLSEGDVFAYYVQGDYIGNFLKVYDASEQNPMSAFLGAPAAYVNMASSGDKYQEIDAENATSGKYNTTYRVSVGRVYSVGSSVVKVALGDTLDDSNLALFYINSDNIVVYTVQSGRKNSIKKGSISDLKDIEHYGDKASKIAVYIKSGRTVSMFVFN